MERGVDLYILFTRKWVQRNLLPPAFSLLLHPLSFSSPGWPVGCHGRVGLYGSKIMENRIKAILGLSEGQFYKQGERVAKGSRTDWLYRGN